MRRDPISPNFTERYGDCDVGVDDWQLPATYRTRTVVEAQASSTGSYPPIKHVHGRAVASNSALTTPRPRPRWTGPLPLGNPLGLSVPGCSPAVHAEHYYHIIGYDAREKFRRAVAYAFLTPRGESEEEVTFYYSQGYKPEGLAREKSKFSSKGGRSWHASYRLNPRRQGAAFYVTKRALAHNAVHCLTMLLLSTIISKG